MTLDQLDAAFVHRWAAAQIRQPAIPAPLPPAPPGDRVPALGRVAPEQPRPEDPILDRLLAAAGPQWEALAGRVEAARSRGRRVIAVAGGERGEGRSTIVAGLVRMLRARGRDVVQVDPHECVAAGAAAGEPSHDRRVILVDAGVWFPPGPIRRQRLLVASLGCDAAILTRRADRTVSPAREAALEALGIEVLGEVLTFAPPAAACDGAGGEAA